MKHQFATDGLPEKLFYAPPVTAETEIVNTANGAMHEQRSPGNWTQSSITSWFEMHGDFDLSVGFDDCTTTGHDHYGCAVVVNCGSGHRIQVGRRHDKKNDNHGVVVGWLIPGGNGEFQPTFESIHTEATSGHLRLARRGDTWYALFAESDSSSFQLVGKQKLEGTGKHSAVFEMQCSHLILFYGDCYQTRLWIKLLRAEVIGQQAHFYKHGHYPYDQRAFVEAYLNGSYFIQAAE